MPHTCAHTIVPIALRHAAWPSFLSRRTLNFHFKNKHKIKVAPNHRTVNYRSGTIAVEVQSIVGNTEAKGRPPPTVKFKLTGIFEGTGEIGTCSKYTNTRIQMSNHIVVESRRTHLTIGVAHAVVGVALALFMNYFLSRLFSLGHQGEKWWDSAWMPLWVACLIYAVEAMWVRLPMAWLYGLLITAPPYGWCAGSLALVYVKNKTEVPASLLLMLFLLGLSGAVLSPVISWLVVRGKRVAWGRRLT
jgi:hypothetical protein